MGRLGIKLLCYNFMPGLGWSHTGVREGRGGAKATYFSLKETVGRVAPNAPLEAGYGDEASSLVNGAGDEAGCLVPMGAAARGDARPPDGALGATRPTSADSARPLADAAPPNPPPATADLAKVARHFGKRIAFIHVRDVEGTRVDFTELFHDQGDVDQFALMRTYRETGLDVPVRGDHVPEMAFDRVLTPDGTPGYFTLGRLFANGYLKALLKGTGNDSRQ